MDDAVALVMATPIIGLCLWFTAFVGDTANAQGRTTVAAHIAAHAAAHTPGTDPADTAQRAALTATVNACTNTTTALDHADPATGTAAVTVTCRYRGRVGPRTVCVTGWAQTDPATTGHIHIDCP